jgi:hypothetical protein
MNEKSRCSTLFHLLVPGGETTSVLVVPDEFLRQNPHLRGLNFSGRTAVAVEAPGRLVCRVGGARLAVRVQTESGTSPDRLEAPVVEVGRLRVHLAGTHPEGALIRSTRNGEILGVVSGSPGSVPAGAAGTDSSGPRQ